MIAETTLLFGALFIGQRPRITTLARRAYPEVEEARTERLDLFAGFRAHVEALHLRTQAA
ncbi:hypothetical protein D3C73_1487450 [compost metagenome]